MAAWWQTGEKVARYGEDRVWKRESDWGLVDFAPVLTTQIPTALYDLMLGEPLL